MFSMLSQYDHMSV